MPRLPSRLLRGARGGRAVPWQMVITVGLQIAREGRKRWDRLTAAEQKQVTALARKSKGRLSMLTPRERAELRRLVTKALGFGR